MAVKNTADEKKKVIKKAVNESNSQKAKGTSIQEKSEKSYSEKRKEEMERLSANRKRKYSIILFAIGIIIVLFIIIGFIGSAISKDETNLLDAVYQFLSGLFGVTVFLVGPVVIYVAILIAKEKTDVNIKKVIWQIIGGILLFSTAVQIIFVGSVAEGTTDLFGAIGKLFSDGVLLHGGGLISGPLSALLLLFGYVGAVVLIVLIIFVYIMFITRKTLIDFFKAVGKPVNKAAKTAKDIRDTRRAEIESYRKEQHELDERTKNEKFNHKSVNSDNVNLESQSEEDKRLRKIRELELATADSFNKPLVSQHKREIDKQKKESNDFIRDIHSYNGNSEKTLPETLSNIVTKPEDIYFDENEKAAGESTLKIGDDVLPGIPSNSETNIISDTLPPIPDTIEENPVKEAIDSMDIEKLGENAEQYDDNTENYDSKNNTVSESEINSEITDNAEKNADEKILTPADQYTLPPIDILDDVMPPKAPEDIKRELEANAQIIIDCLKSFGVQAKVIGVCRGPSVTRYELQPAPGVKISRITGLSDDIALYLAASGIRIEAPIPGKPAIGIEVPNKVVETVPFRTLIEGNEIKQINGKLAAVLGKDISGETIIANIADMPHLLIAGTTGSGKSVCVNSIIMSILFRSTPDEVRFIMIDPKAVEFMTYNGIPHLLIPVVTDPKKAAGALAWAVTEMLHRYNLFSEYNVRQLSAYNALAKNDPEMKLLPEIVIFIDELADLIMASKNEVEDSICRLAQMARAAGMHLVIATQRPTVDVVTGLIKSNIPSRIALKVSSGVDSRTILDEQGAEKLLGHGDMLFKSVSMPKPKRVQGCWISDKEVERVVTFIKNSFILDYDDEVIKEVERRAELVKTNDKSDEGVVASGDIDVNDDKLEDAIRVVVEAGQASTSALQRRLKLGYGRAARLIDVMEEMGIVGPSEGSKPRQVLMSKEEYYERNMNTQE